MDCPKQDSGPRLIEYIRTANVSYNSEENYRYVEENKIKAGSYTVSTTTKIQRNWTNDISKKQQLTGHARKVAIRGNARKVMNVPI